MLSEDRRLALDLAVEAIAADPDLRVFREDFGDFIVDVADPNLFVTFRRIDRYHGELLSFAFLDER